MSRIVNTPADVQPVFVQPVFGPACLCGCACERPSAAGTAGAARSISTAAAR